MTPGMNHLACCCGGSMPGTIWLVPDNLPAVAVNRLTFDRAAAAEAEFYTLRWLHRVADEVYLTVALEDGGSYYFFYMLEEPDPGTPTELEVAQLGSALTPLGDPSWTPTMGSGWTGNGWQTWDWPSDTDFIRAGDLRLQLVAPEYDATHTNAGRYLAAWELQARTAATGTGALSIYKDDSCPGVYVWYHELYGWQYDVYGSSHLVDDNAGGIGTPRGCPTASSDAVGCILFGVRAAPSQRAEGVDKYKIGIYLGRVTAAGAAGYDTIVEYEYDTGSSNIDIVFPIQVPRLTTSPYDSTYPNAGARMLLDSDGLCHFFYGAHVRLGTTTIYYCKGVPGSGSFTSYSYNPATENLQYYELKECRTGTYAGIYSGLRVEEDAEEEGVYWVTPRRWNTGSAGWETPSEIPALQQPEGCVVINYSFTADDAMRIYFLKETATTENIIVYELPDVTNPEWFTAGSGTADVQYTFYEGSIPNEPYEE